MPVCLFYSASWAAPAPGFSLIGGAPASWPLILGSVGFTAAAPADSAILIARPGTPAAPVWRSRVESGAYLLLEGESPVAESFGFRAGKNRVRIASTIDGRNPRLPIIWQKQQEMPRFDVPRDAQIFVRERWTLAPLMAGYRLGGGAVLWVAASPGELGYERYPYLLHALADLGLKPPYQSRQLWAFFDYAYRMRVDLEYFAARWREAGIAALHVAAWHFFEADSDRDAYLKKLIAVCHERGITVYAWLELPHVSEKFWDDHPEWREKTALLQDAHLDWRKLMNLTNRDCFRAVSRGLEALVNRFDWDGVNLAELYFESLEGAGNPSRFTPMNDDVRAQYRNLHGTDPVTVYQTKAFLDFRAELARRMQEEWIQEVERFRKALPHLDLVLTHVDDRLDAGMQEAIGVDVTRVLPLLAKHNFTFMVEDPATIWNLGPQRYPELARRYQALTPSSERLAIDINIVERYQDVYPTKQQTGTELFQLVHLAANSFPRVALYFENSISKTDMSLLPAAAAVVRHVRPENKGIRLETPYGVGVPWSGPALVDGHPWPVADTTTIWLPAGSHIVEAGGTAPAFRVLDFNGGLERASILEGAAVEIVYDSPARALAVLDRKPSRVHIDAIPFAPQLAGTRTVVLPRGKHVATIVPE